MGMAPESYVLTEASCAGGRISSRILKGVVATRKRFGVLRVSVCLIFDLLSRHRLTRKKLFQEHDEFFAEVR